jgi:hypothetical protein
MSTIDNLSNNKRNTRIINLQAESAIAITVNDLTNYTPSCLYIGTGGNVQITDATGNTTIFTNIPEGTILPVLVTRVFTTNTTASGFVLLN